MPPRHVTDENVAFYQGRGYRVMDEVTVMGTDLRIRAMRRTATSAV